MTKLPVRIAEAATDARPEDHAKRQRRVLAIMKKIIEHADELQGLADELDGMGCGCGRAADQQPYLHAHSCPVWVAWSIGRARPTYKAPVPSTSLKDVRHLTAPFRPIKET